MNYKCVNHVLILINNIYTWIVINITITTLFYKPITYQQNYLSSLLTSLCQWQ